MSDAKQKVKDLTWNILDAREALKNASEMSDWDGVIKYATQLKKLEYERFMAEPPSQSFALPSTNGIKP